MFKPLIRHIYCKMSAAGYSHLCMTPRCPFNELPVVPPVAMFTSWLRCKHHNLIKPTFKEPLPTLTHFSLYVLLSGRTLPSILLFRRGWSLAQRELRPWIFQAPVSRSSSSLICEPTLNYAATPAQSPNCESSFEILQRCWNHCLSVLFIDSILLFQSPYY